MKYDNYNANIILIDSLWLVYGYFMVSLSLVVFL